MTIEGVLHLGVCHAKACLALSERMHRMTKSRAALLTNSLLDISEAAVVK